MASDPASALVTPEWLSDRLADDLLILDVRSAVDGAGREAFEAAHIPGAVHSDYAKGGWRATVGMASGMLPDDAALVALLGAIGLTPRQHVVVVSAGTTAGDFSGAARVYWTLKVVGHPKVSILDGGMQAWQRDPARSVERGPGKAVVSTPPYPIAHVGSLRADLGEVQKAVASGTAVLLDSRATSYFEGRDKSPAAARPGRLPGARQVFHAECFDPAAKALRPRAALVQLFGALPPGTVINYCNTGQQAATTWFVLSEMLGRPASLYDGSMSEWAQDPERPIATGERD
jgi:thiosulfate/3-mercaptopyruvate sulfurtransferase